MNRARFRLKSVAVGIAAAFSAPVFALPTAPAVSNGSASFSQNGGTLTVTNTPNAIINWGSFSIGRNEIARFVQQSAASAVLNRVVGQDPSLILGQLQSNGRVFLINPNGIVFGAGSRVDTAGLIASTLKLSDADFLAGRMRFTGNGTEGRLENQGTINTSSGGFVYLIAPDVENSGIVNSPNGDVLLAAGKSVEVADGLNPALRTVVTAPAGGGVNLGQIFAEGGRIGLHAGIVSNAGTISASSAIAEGGKIYLRATNRIALADTSKLRADGTAGGEISAIVGQDGQIGGELVARGEISAQGTAHGGFVETSAAKVDLNGISVRTSGGTWLIDPNDFTIAASGGDISGATLSANLGAGNVNILSSSGTTAGSGDINVNDAVSWSANKLTLSAYRNIQINQAMNGSGTASLALEYGQGAVAAGNTADYILAAGVKVSLPAGNNFSTKLGSDGATNTYTVITSLGAAGSVTTTDLQGMSGGLSGMYALGADINATATATSGWNAGLGFLPIGGCCSLATAFTGTFEGLGHTITGLTINRPSTAYAGLFGYAGYVAFPSNAITPASIRDVGLVGGSVSGNFAVGGLVGYLRTGSTVANSYNTGTVSGAMAGSNVNAGGLVGWGDGNIVNSYSTGNVSASAGNQVGGLVGSIAGTLTDSFSTGNVSGNNWVGGLVGATGGFAVIARTYSTGSVSGNSAVGGLAGYAGGITNSYSTGAVNGGIYVGGLVGYITGPITNTYSTGAVIGTTNVGGLAGWNNGNSVINSFWDTTTSGLATGVGFGFTNGVTGMATANMKTLANFTSATAANGNVNPNWDFAATWVMTNGLSYPMLRAFMIPLTVSASAASKTYDGLAFNGGNGATYSGFTGGDTAAVLGGTLSYGGTSQGAVNAGSYTIIPSGLSSAKYNITYVNGGLTISPAALTVAANNASKTYDGSGYSGGNGVAYTGFVNGQNAAVLGGTLAYGGTAQGAVNAGSYTIVPSGLTSSNYSISYANGALTVTAAAPANNTWLGLMNSNWTTVGNWSLGHVPTATETVVIPVVGGTTFVQISGGAFVVKSITSAELFKLTGAGTSVTLTTSGSFNAGLNLGAGTSLTSQGTLSLSSYTLGAGAKINLTQSGTGILTIAGLPYTVINSLGAAGSVTALDLQGMRGNLSARYALGSDIDASPTTSWNAGSGFAPVGDSTTPFTGTFDGLGHAITNLAISLPSSNNVGLFGYARGATLTNVGLEGGSIAGLNAVGSLVGFNDGGTISISHNTGQVQGDTTVQSSDSVGGLIGKSVGGTISDSYNTGSVKGTQSVGGVVGFSSAMIANSWNGGSVTATYQNAGGLVGFQDNGTITDSHNVGDVTGYDYVGGLVGWKWKTGLVNNSYSTGAVSGFRQVGGLVGNNGGFILTGQAQQGDTVAADSIVSNSYSTGSVTGAVDVGGLVGYNLGAIRSSYSTGNVTASSTATDNVGGFVGFNQGVISNSYSTGNVNSYIAFPVGGFVGMNEVNPSSNISGTGGIINSYSTGMVTTRTGTVASSDGFAGVNYGGNIAKSYWNTDTSGTLQCSVYSVDGCSGLTTAQMKQRASFPGWDFSTVWAISEGLSFPYLRLAEQVPHPAANGSLTNLMDILGSTAAPNGVMFAANQAVTPVVTNLVNLGQFFKQESRAADADAVPSPSASDSSSGRLSEAAALAPILTQIIRDARNEEPNYGTCLVCRR